MRGVYTKPTTGGISQKFRMSLDYLGKDPEDIDMSYVESAVKDTYYKLRSEAWRLYSGDRENLAQENRSIL